MPAQGPLPSPPLVPGAVHTVEVEGVDDRGRGLATLGRRTLRVSNALPGEHCAVRLEHVGRHLVVGRIEAVRRASPDRVPDDCPHGTVCPGCGLRTTAPEARRRFLRGLVTAAFRGAGLPETRVDEVVAAPDEDGWRHKAFLTARRTRRGLFLGLYQEGTHRLLGIAGCRAHAPAVEGALDGLRGALTRHDPPTYDERTGQGWLRYAVVRASAATGDAVVTLVATAPDAGLGRRIAIDARQRARHIRGVVLNVHPERGNAPLGDRYLALDGEGAIEEASGPHRLRVSAGSFFQVNPRMGARIHEDAVGSAAAAPPGWALDLYGGVGATALRLAATGRPVVLVEAPGPGAEDARHNALREAPGKVEVRAGRVEEALGPLLARSPAVALMDPPRGGLTPPVLAALAERPVPWLIYLACNPDSLARDVRHLAESAYQVESVRPYDLMPQTPHVETLAVLKRRT